MITLLLVNRALPGLARGEGSLWSGGPLGQLFVWLWLDVAEAKRTSSGLACLPLALAAAFIVLISVYTPLSPHSHYSPFLFSAALCLMVN